MSVPVERSVFYRLRRITTATAVAVCVLVLVFFALTVHPHFESEAVNAHLRAAHFPLVLPVALLIAGIIYFAHTRVRRLLEPLRALADGVDRLTAGQLDVTVPHATSDEFAALTDAFNTMVERVRGMVAARDQLLLDVSHELRSPITRIKVGLELLPDGDARAGLAADVRELEAMVTELLELERLRDGRALRLELIDVAQLAREVSAGFGHARPPVVLSANTACVVRGDARMLTMAIRNLVDNAVTHALPDSGPVEVRVAGGASGVTVVVSDDGPGVPESELARIFEPFYRADPSRSRRTGGYGLGLSICRRAAEAHGGALTAERKPGRGTIFVLALPPSADRSPSPPA